MTGPLQAVSPALARWTLLGAGGATVVAWLVASVTHEGGSLHRWAGRAGMASAVVAAVGAAARPGVERALTAGARGTALDPGPPAVLAALGVYLLASGVRSLSRKRVGRDFGSATDWTLAVMALPVGAWLVDRGARSVFLEPVGRSPAMLAFGLVGLAVALVDLWSYYHPPTDEAEWVYRHVGRSVAGAAATATAASAVAPLPVELPPGVRWVWAPLLGALVAGVAFAHFERRFEGGESPGEVFTDLRWGTDPGREG